MSLRFAADAMLGRLARWLRALGYDTFYSAHLSDEELAVLAGAEGRLLLTRDRQLARRRGVNTLLIESDQLEEQLRQLMRTLALEPPGAPFGRCLACNGRLHALDKRDLIRAVPPYVWRTQEDFHGCPQCGRIYWRGTHWQRMQAAIERLVAAAGSSPRAESPRP